MGTNKLKFILLIIKFIYFINCTAQSTFIQGFIKEKTSEIFIDFANVTIINPLDNSYINFAFSDNLGFFSLELTDTLPYKVLSITKLGYEEFRDTIYKSKIYNRQNYFLNTSSILFDEIIINDKAPKVISKNDTTFINARKFATGDEHKMEDILKKLPGIEVDNNGRMKFNGRTITKVLFDGDNLLGENYTVGTRNISSNVIDKVEIIDNFSSNPLLRGIVNSNEMIINIKVDEKFKFDISGSLDIGIGTDSQKSKYLTNLHLFSLGKKTKSLLIHNTNNVRQDIGDIESIANENNTRDNNDNYLNKPILQLQSGKGAQYINDVYLNKGLRSLSRISALHPINKNLKTNFSANVFYDITQSNEEDELIYFQANDSLKLRNKIQIIERKLGQIYDTNTEYIDLINGLSITFKSVFILRRNINFTEFKRKDDELEQNNQNFNNLCFNQVEIFKKIKTSLIQFRTEYDNYQMTEDAMYKNPFLDNKFDQPSLNQYVNGRYNRLLTFLKIMNRKNIKYDISIGYKNNLQNLNTKLETTISPKLNLYSNLNKRVVNEFYTEIYHFNKVKNMTYFFTSAIYSSKLTNSQNLTFIRKYFNLKTELELPYWWKISLDAVYSESLSRINLDMTNPILIDIQTTFLGRDTITKPINKNITLSINKKNDFKGYYLNLFASYYIKNLEFGDHFKFDESFIFEKSLFYPNINKNFLTGFRYSLIIDKFRSKFTISSVYSLNKGNNFINDIERFYTATSLNAQVEYFLNLKKINLNIRYNRRYSNFYVYPFNTNVCNLSENLEIKPIIKLGDNLSFENTLIYNKLINQCYSPLKSQTGLQK